MDIERGNHMYVSIRPLNNPDWDAAKASIFKVGSRPFNHRMAKYAHEGVKVELVDATARRDELAAHLLSFLTAKTH